MGEIPNSSLKQQQSLQQEAISPKEQKTYEKKLKVYEKEKARYEYFLANKSRLVKNKAAVEKSNQRSTTSYTRYTIDPGFKLITAYGFLPKDKIIETIQKVDIKIKVLDDTVKTLAQYSKTRDEADIKELADTISRGCKLSSQDKEYGFMPIYTGAFTSIVSLDYGSMDKVPLFNVIFSFPPLPTKPTPPEKPKNQTDAQQLAELAQEVLQTKEMDISRHITRDTKILKREIMIDRQTIEVDPQTSDLYIQYKATRSQRPNDPDLSFVHFKEKYLDKHPQFMRKEQ